MKKSEQLATIKKTLLNDKALPLRGTATHLVFGEGNSDADLYFLGEAPGRQEDLTGRPFVGLAGKLLDRLLTSIDLKREDVYISNIVRYRPPNNRPPHPSEIEAFAKSVVEEIAIVNPRLLIPLGRFPMGKFLRDTTISQARGKLHRVTWNGLLLQIYPVYHPAAALRSTKMKKALEEDFKKIPEVLENLKKK